MASPELCSLGSSTDEDMGQICNLCNGKFVMPRVLSCLHVYCEQCLLTNLKNESHQEGFLTCPDCKQDTKLNAKGVTGLPVDYIACNQMDMEAIEKMQIVCTSCKAKEKAVARCSDCATFLCPNCVTAHQYMRCFENHKVVSFEEMKSSGDNMTIHKPVTCPSHPDEVMKYYCYKCHVPICNECMVMEHKQPDHHYEKASDAEPKQREELKNLVAESRNKIKFCEETSSFLSNCLSELQMQRDNVKSHVEETFQSYKVILEKNVEHLLQELDTLHTNHELKVMETFHSVEKTIEKIDDACSFANRLLNHGNTLEVLSLKRFVGTQLLSLINNTPKPEVSVTLTFETNEKNFEDAVKKTFGKIKKPEPPVKREEESPQFHKISPLHSSSSFESEGYSLSSGVSPENSLRSLDVDLANNLVAQYNIAQLAGMAERSVSQNSRETPPPVSFPDLLIPATERELTATAAQMNALNNLTALAKMGSVSLSNGQSSLNGPLGSLHLDSTPHSPVLSPPVSSQAMRSVTTPSPIDSLESLLNGTSIVPTTSRIGSPLEGPLINGTALTGRALQNSSLLSSPSLSSVSGSGYNPAPRSASVRMNTMQIRLSALESVIQNSSTEVHTLPVTAQIPYQAVVPLRTGTLKGIVCLEYRCKFGQLGPGKSQFSSPHGFCLGLDEEIIVADTNNHRIQIFDKTGEFRYQFGEPGKEEGQLWYPRKVAVIRNSGKFVICDRGSERSRMQIFTKTGHFLKKIAIRYIDIVAGLAITNEGNIVAVDSVAPTVFVISETGELLHWFDCSEYMREPSDIAVSGEEYYICDFKGHCVIVFSEDGKFMRRIGCENVTNFPNGIDISDAGDVLVGDSHGNRFHIVVFSRQGTLLSEFECPYVKVSRCCGLKITSEGYVVTLAKNNHHVLVLNTLYIV